MRVTIGDSGLCCCTCVNVFQAAANELSHVSVIQSNASKFSVLFLFKATPTDEDDQGGEDGGGGGGGNCRH